MSLATVAQDSFATGIYRLTEPQKAPADSVYDAVDALLDDEGAIYRRGGTAYLGTVTGSATWKGLAWTNIGALGRLLGWNATNNLVTFDDSLTTRVSLGLSDSPAGTAKPAVAGGMAAFASANFANRVLLYGGSRNTTTYSTGTTAVTAGSRTVTGTGTLFTANVEPGSLYADSANVGVFVVESVDSNTQLTLRQPIRTTGTGLSYTTKIAEVRNIPALPATGAVMSLAAVANRLVACKDNRAAFSAIQDPWTFDDLDYHELPADATTLGASSVRDTLVWFTTRGVWAVSNMAFDLTDPQGNVQQRLERINDLVLWGQPAYGGACGVAGWQGNLIVPAVDDVYLLGLDGQAVSLGEKIRPLYRSYVTAGYVPGAAQVFNGHYLLPINDTSGAPQAMLVCKLQGAAWTRWSVQSRALTVRPPSTTAQAALWGPGGTRLIDLTPCWTTANANDAGGAFDFVVTTRAFALSRQTATFWKWLRGRHTAVPSNVTATSTGPAAGPTVLSSSTTDTGAEWLVDQRGQSVQFVLTWFSHAVLRSLEVHARQSGKR